MEGQTEMGAELWGSGAVGRLPEAFQCSPPGLAANRLRFLTLTLPWEAESPDEVRFVM